MGCCFFLLKIEGIFFIISQIKTRCRYSDKKLQRNVFMERKSERSYTFTGLQIYGGPGSLSRDFKIWPITFQGSGPSEPILFSCENISL